MHSSAIQNYKCHYMIVSNHTEELQVQAFGCERGSSANIHCSGLSVSSDKDVSSYNLTEHEQRQVLDSKGISQAYRVFWVCSALNFMTGHKMPKIHAK